MSRRFVLQHRQNSREDSFLEAAQDSFLCTHRTWSCLTACLLITLYFLDVTSVSGMSGHENFSLCIGYLPQ